MKLYKRNAQGKPIVWEGIDLGDNTYQVRYGLVGGNIHSEVKHDTKAKVNELDSLIKAKRKEGYKTLEDLYDNSPTKITDAISLYSYLNVYLPKYNVSDTGAILPMLAKTLEDNKPFIKGDYDGQWKINGVRCIIGAKRANDMFNPIVFTYHSREGTEWNLAWMDKILYGVLHNTYLLDLMIEEDVCLDGELYIPGYKVNDINSFVKNNKIPQHYQLQYWCYDLAVENYSAVKRYTILESAFNRSIPHINTKEDHLNNKQQFVLLPTFDNILDINSAIAARNKFIDLGFEGLILRNEDSEYCFGKRRAGFMYKFKKIEDGKFEIIDIIPEGKKRSNLCKFVLRNDINDATFECTLNAPQTEQERILVSKNSYIGHYLACVEYRERSGVKQVPFHAKIVKLIKHES